MMKRHRLHRRVNGTAVDLARLRRQLTHPKLDQLPGHGCVTGH
ncbi:hypothetical protein [Nonomuraea fuscirosea]